MSNVDLNYYEMLGVSQDSSTEQISVAYRKIITRYHPDIVGEQGIPATKLFNKIYDILKDPEKRREYDNSLRSQQGTTESAVPDPTTPEPEEETHPNYEEPTHRRRATKPEPKPFTPKKTAVPVLPLFSKRVNIELAILLIVNVVSILLWRQLYPDTSTSGFTGITTIGSYIPPIATVTALVGVIYVANVVSYGYRGIVYISSILLSFILPVVLPQDFARIALSFLVSLTVLGVVLLVLEGVMALCLLRWNKFAKKYADNNRIGIYYVVRMRETPVGEKEYMILNLASLKDSTVALWGEAKVGEIVAINQNQEIIQILPEYVANTYFARKYSQGILFNK